MGGKNSYKSKSREDAISWHRNGGKSNAAKQKVLKTHPFYTGKASSLGGKAVKGMIELWNPVSKAVNKNQKEYQSGDCKKAVVGSEKYTDLISNGWLTISEHKKRIVCNH